MNYLEFLIKRFWACVLFFLLSLGLVCSCNDVVYRNAKEGYYTKNNVACTIKYAEIEHDGHYYILGLYAKGKSFRENVTPETYHSCKDRIGETVYFSLSDADIGLKGMSILFPLGIISALTFIFISPVVVIEPQGYGYDKTYLKWGRITVIIFDLILVIVGLGLFLYSRSLM